MQSILTRLTIAAGEHINNNNNILENRVDYSKVDFQQFIKDLKKENPELASELTDYIQNSDLIKKNNKAKSSPSRSYSRSSSSCGNEGGSIGCGRSASRSSWRSSSSCGYSSRSSC